MELSNLKPNFSEGKDVITQESKHGSFLTDDEVFPRKNTTMDTLFKWIIFFKKERLPNENSLFHLRRCFLTEHGTP